MTLSDLQLTYFCHVRHRLLSTWQKVRDSRHMLFENVQNAIQEVFEVLGAMLGRENQCHFRVGQGRPYKLHYKIPKGVGLDRRGSSLILVDMVLGCPALEV